MRILSIVGLLTQLLAYPAASQFSPGDLSRAHKDLEGTTKCATCHEVGKEISGRKCLACHTEVQGALDAKRGFHFNVSGTKCTTCHKEHLGRDAQATVFQKETFDHVATGFALTGKHTSTKCEACHQRKNIRSPQVLEMLARTPRNTFLGLNTACISCHADRHAGRVGEQCQTCHSTAGWTPATGFDHVRTSFPLSGKHANVECAKCHTAIKPGKSGEHVMFSTQAFSDCTPCHTSPHASSAFSSQQCQSCHTPEGWRGGTPKSFNHEMTSFKLVGRHTTLQCQQCHKERGGPGSAYRLAHARCTDCHTDYHRGEFAATYNNDCSKCHTERGFSPSTFSLARHAGSRFALTGAHTAIPCISCHRPAGVTGHQFRVSDFTCEACHRDRHDGQFKNMMAEKSCATCHETGEWKRTLFDHGKTGFPLRGRHVFAACNDCHKPLVSGVVRYRGTAGDCYSCHTDAHGGQFAVNGTTDCSRCHTPEGWKQVVFDHNTQSAFSLSGAHARVDCRFCHINEMIAGGMRMRFKPLPVRCESCHTDGAKTDG